MAVWTGRGERIKQAVVNWSRERVTARALPEVDPTRPTTRPPLRPGPRPGAVSARHPDPTATGPTGAVPLRTTQQR